MLLVVDVPPVQQRSRPPRRTETTRATHGRKKKNRGPFALALRVCLVSVAPSRIPPTSRTLRTASEGTPHTRVVWAKSGRLLPVCRVAVLGYAVKVAGLFVSLPRTRLSVFLSLPRSLYIMHISSPSRMPALCLIASLAAPPLSSPRLSSWFVHRIHRGVSTTTSPTGAGLVFESAAPITQGETSLGSPTWSFKVDDGTSLLQTLAGNILVAAAERFTGMRARSAFRSCNSGR